MPNKKKQPKNAFYFFMLELQDEYRRHNEHLKLVEIADRAGPRWRALSPEERAPYEEQARREKSMGRTKGKLDSYGNSVDELKRLDEEEKEGERQMTAFIEKHLQYLGSKEEIAKESFFFISIKIFCVTDEEHYIPAELGIVEYSIGDGIINHYHRFIDPGPLPRGYSFKCKENSDSTHKIPILNFELADKDYRGIFTEIKNMLSAGDARAGTWPPLYCYTEEMKQIEYILNWLQYEAGSRTRISLKIYDVAALFYELLRTSSNEPCSIGIVHDHLTSTAFMYNSQTCCPWHWEEDNPEHCALGMAKKIGYIFSDHLCDHFDIVPVANCHLPERDLNDSVDVLPPSYTIKPSRRPAAPILKSSKPLSTSGDSIITSIKSRYNTEEQSYFVPSAQSAIEGGPSLASSQSSIAASGLLQPLRQPKNKSFAAAMATTFQPQFKLEARDFPVLDKPDDSRSELSLEDPNASFRSSASIDGSVSRWITPLQREKRAIPSGRGIGRGRLVEKK